MSSGGYYNGPVADWARRNRQGGKLVIPPMIHRRAEVWALVNSMLAEVRDDGVPRRAVRPRPASHRTGPGSN